MKYHFYTFYSYCFYRTLAYFISLSPFHFALSARSTIIHDTIRHYYTTTLYSSTIHTYVHTMVTLSTRSRSETPAQHGDPGSVELLRVEARAWPILLLIFLLLLVHSCPR